MKNLLLLVFGFVGLLGAMNFVGEDDRYPVMDSWVVSPPEESLAERLEPSAEDYSDGIKDEIELDPTDLDRRLVKVPRRFIPRSRLRFHGPGAPQNRQKNQKSRLQELLKLRKQGK